MRLQRNKIVIICCLIVASSLVLGCIVIASQTNTRKDISNRSPSFRSPINTEDTYVAPINPYDTPEEWAQFRTGFERTEATQIPAEILSEISTAGLVNTYLNSHFFFGHIFTNTNIQDGFDATVGVYNGLQELLSRGDCGTALLDLYKALDLKMLYENDEYPFLRLQSIELLCSQESVLNTLSPK